MKRLANKVVKASAFCNGAAKSVSGGIPKLAESGFGSRVLCRRRSAMFLNVLV